MVLLIAALAARLRQLTGPQMRDRGEVGPIGYTVMVAGIVVLAIAVVAWGQGIADNFMEDFGGE